MSRKLVAEVVSPNFIETPEGRLEFLKALKRLAVKAEEFRCASCRIDALRDGLTKQHILLCEFFDCGFEAEHSLLYAQYLQRVIEAVPSCFTGVVTLDGRLERLKI
jgi:hypothetical protein